MKSLLVGMSICAFIGLSSMAFAKDDESDSPTMEMNTYKQHIAYQDETDSSDEEETEMDMDTEHPSGANSDDTDHSQPMDESDEEDVDSSNSDNQ